MRRIMINTICGIALVGLLATGILRAQTESEPQTTAGSDDLLLKAQKRKGCTNETIQGRYAVRTQGSIVGVGPFAAVGVMTFDGSGNLTNAATTSTNGNIVSGETAGTYSVNDDCTGQMAFPSISGPPLTFNFVIADRGDEISIIATRAPAVLIGVGNRID